MDEHKIPELVEFNKKIMLPEETRGKGVPLITLDGKGRHRVIPGISKQRLRTYLEKVLGDSPLFRFSMLELDRSNESYWGVAEVVRTYKGTSEATMDVLGQTWRGIKIYYSDSEDSERCRNIFLPYWSSKYLPLPSREDASTILGVYLFSPLSSPPDLIFVGDQSL